MAAMQYSIVSTWRRTNQSKAFSLCCAYQGDVAVVPRVVVHQRGSVGHAGDLVSVVPPRHHSGVLIRVLPQPVVSLPEVIQDVSGAGRGKNRGVCG